MTTQQLHLFNGIYLVVLVVVAVLTRATARRIAGALAGGAAFGVVALGIIAFGEEVGWVAHGNHLGAVLPDATADRLHLVRVHLPHHLADRPPVRLARTGGGRGRLSGHWPGAGLLVHGAVPGMGAYGPGIAPVLAIAATYAVMVLLGHGVMRLIAGPARANRLARRPWESC